MVEHEQQSTSAGPTGRTASAAEDTRVTAEEFTSALRSIEQRRKTESDRVAGTVGVADTIRELNIDATPEEILEEVMAERARQTTAEQAKSDIKSRARQTAGDAWDYASAAYQTIRERIEKASTESNASAKPFRPIQVNLNVKPPRIRARSHGSLGGTIFGLLIAWVAVSLVLDTQIPKQQLAGLPILRIGVGPTLRLEDLPAIRIVEEPLYMGAVMPLAKAPPMQTVYGDTDKVIAIASEGGELAGEAGSVLVETNQVNNSWPIVRFDGKAYVQGFASEGALPIHGTQTITIYNTIAAAELQNGSADAVTVPLAGATVVYHSVQDDWSDMTIKRSTGAGAN